jgi:hypothetical protein
VKFQGVEAPSAVDLAIAVKSNFDDLCLVLLSEDGAPVAGMQMTPIELTQLIDMLIHAAAEIGLERARSIH